MQDRRGLIWIGTQDGLNRFDGYDFKVHQKRPHDPASLSDNFIRALCQARDGAIWVGTESGLDRFDPEKEVFKEIPLGEIESASIRALEKGKDGKLWIGTREHGLFLLRPDSSSADPVHPLPTKKGILSGETIHTLEKGRKGELWIGTGESGLFRYDTEDEGLKPTPLGNARVWDLAPIDDSTYWVGTDRGAFLLEGGERDMRIKTRIGKGEASGELPHSSVSSVLKDREGRVWFGTDGGGLCRLYRADGKIRFHRYRHQDYISSSLVSDKVLTVREDRSGSIWVGSNLGLSKFDPKKQNFKTFTSRIIGDKGLNDKNVWAVQEGPDSALWVGTRKGITRIDRAQDEFQHFEPAFEESSTVDDQSVLSLQVGERVWAGTMDGLYELKKAGSPSQAFFEKAPYVPVGEGDPVRGRVYRILREGGRLLLGTRNGLRTYRSSDGRTRLYDDDSNSTLRLSGSVVRDIHRGSDGDLWIATDGGGLDRIQGIGVEGEKDSVLEVHRKDPEDPHSLNSNSLMSIWEGEQGFLWIGTYGGGLNRLDPSTGRVKHYTEKDGLPNNVVYGILGDGEGKLWMSTNRGLCRFDKEKKRFRVFHEEEGLQSNEFNAGAYYRSPSDELFFGGIEGLNAFYPSKIQKNPYPPELILLDLELFNAPNDPQKGVISGGAIKDGGRIILSPEQDDITIRFAALHYTRPEKNRYRYFLSGFDKDTVEAGTQRTAHYTNLDPGTYRFEVFACNSDGVWREEPATLEIVVQAPYWMTWWFQGGLILIGLGAVFLIYRYRVSLIEEQKRKLEFEVRRRTQEVTRQKEQIQEQNELLEKEKEKVEKLLVNLLPEDTANELKTGGRASARHYRLTTVMFTDFKAFTKIAERMKATELVARLDSYFIKFDHIIERWELEKIKTIGDSYMCAGGIPIRNKTNPIHTVLAGLEIQRYMLEQQERLRERGEEPWELRIGIHTGELIAGVIGIKRYAYDIWGDTVNVASRMESNGEVGKVNISGTTYSYIEPFFECDYRGKVHAKNKGHIDMYFVKGIKPELSVDGKGETPNQAFWDYLNLHFFSKIDYRKAEKALLKKLNKELPDNLYYHDVRHTKDVCQAVERLAFMEGIEGEELFLLKTAALFHDAGFVEQYENNEWIGARMAREMLPNYGYTEERIAQIESMIHATQVPPAPKDHLEEIICDADLDYLGREDFHEIADKLRMELMERGYIQSMIEWDRLQVKFLKEHRYFTESAINLRRKKKLEHLAEIEERLRKLEKEESQEKD